MSSLKNTGIAVDINLLNAKTKIWLKDIANQSIHGTTKPSPYVLFNGERAAFSVYAEKHLELKMNITPEQIIDLAQELKLNYLDKDYAVIAQETTMDKLSYTEFLYKILLNELRLKNAKLKDTFVKFAGWNYQNYR